MLGVPAYKIPSCSRYWLLIKLVHITELNYKHQGFQSGLSGTDSHLPACNKKKLWLYEAMLSSH